MKAIETTLNFIKYQTGLNLNMCDGFPGVYTLGNETYFNILLSKRVSESPDFITLERFSKKYKAIRVEPNGLNRVAVFFKQN